MLHQAVRDAWFRFGGRSDYPSAAEQAPCRFRYTGRPMPTDWSEGILLAELADEPELSEELSAVFARLRGEGTGGDDDGAHPEFGSARQGARGEKALTPADNVPHVVLNFSGVSYVNSTHIAALLRMRKRLSEAGKLLVLCSLGEGVWSTILLTGLDKVFQFAPDPMTALASVQLHQERSGPNG